jgi:NAD(P)-dependent dehydrogenase (short-subunit alcohol dehydrogenase family)
MAQGDDPNLAAPFAKHFRECLKDMQRFNERCAIVTGGASGIGAGVATRLAGEGARVCLIDRDLDELRRQAERMDVGGDRVSVRQANVCDERDLRTAFNECVERWGRLDILVHSAGVVGPSGINVAEYPVEEFRSVLDVNLTGSFIACQCALPHMLRQGYGRILLLASMAGKDGNPGMAGYVASKAGVIGLVKGLGKEYACDGITINALAPAVIATPLNATTDPRVMQQLTQKIPMQRLGTIAEAAAIACWICSEEASFNTGAIFDLSGGRATY